MPTQKRVPTGLLGDHIVDTLDSTITRSTEEDRVGCPELHEYIIDDLNSEQLRQQHSQLIMEEQAILHISFKYKVLSTVFTNT